MESNRQEIFKEHPIEWDDQKVSRIWDYYSRTPPYSEQYFSKIFGRAILKHARVPIDQSIKLLDFGCGPGFIWDHLMALGAKLQYTAIDFSSDSIKKLQAKASGHAQFYGASLVKTLPTDMAAESFDVVLLFEVVEHLNDDYLSSTLTEAARVLKPGATLVVTTPNNENLADTQRFCPECGSIFHQWQHVRSWSVDSLSDYLKDFGFELSFAKTLDMRAQTVLSKTLLWLKQLIRGYKSEPHMIAVFKKR